jgi:tetratricopeptide (TPR) repeat protein
LYHLKTSFLALAILALSSAHLNANTAPITVDYPSEGSIFPPEFPAPTFLWRDAARNVTSWVVEVSFPGGSASIRVNARGERIRIGAIDPRCVGPTNKTPTLTPQQAAAHTWTPDAAVWASIKKHPTAIVTINGFAAGLKQAVSRGQVSIQTSADAVGAPIFYRDVPLMPSETEKGVIKPLAAGAVPLIAWRLRNVAETSSRVLMEGIHSCANCHSVSRDGKTLGMDVDGPLNDKGLYALVSIRPQTTIRNEDVIAWSSFQGKLGSKLRVGFMSQVSPDGEHVVTTINDPAVDQSDYERRKNPQDLAQNYYVANFKDYRFLQVFYPTRGILAWYNRATGKLQRLPGADDPRYVHTNAVWSPDGKFLVFARAEARDPYPAGAKLAAYANDPGETRIQYDLYRIPFNDGKGGRAEPIAGAAVNGMSNSFPKVSPDGRWIIFVEAKNGQLMRPDSQLFIVPVEGGTARRMNCNTALMNSWHSFSPNGRWLVFSSKSRSPYTQMFLTHLDEAGNDSPAILIENSTAANRAVNIPEFINVPQDGLLKIDAPATEYYRVVNVASELVKKGEYEAAIAQWNKALELSPNEALAHFNLGNALVSMGRGDEAITHYEKALELSPGHSEAHNNLGNVLLTQRKLDEALAHFEKAVELNPDNANARSNLGSVLAQKGRITEAIPHLQKAVDFNPGSADAQNNLGVALAMTGSFDAGIVALAEAVKLSGGREPAFLDVLSAVYAEAGRYKEAAQTARKALAMAVQRNNPRMAEALKARIAAYEMRIAAE